MSAEELRKEVEARLEADTKLKALMDQSGSNNPPPSGAIRIPTSGCGAGQGLKPDPTGFGRWTCQKLGGFTVDQNNKRANAERLLHEAQGNITMARTAKGDVLDQTLLDIEQNFRAASGLFFQAGDTDSADMALGEAARISLIRFLENHEKKKPTDQECERVVKNFDSINRDDPQALQKVNDVSQMCSKQALNR